MKGTSIETIESPNATGPPNWSKEGRNKREATAVFDVVPDLAEDDDMAPVGLV